ncbi:MAG: rhomboid family intramembrane serine protease [Fibrobacteria bacterium]|nr:rhomboid family intramembrane serine protease [Fibrobacteria bacterium]
MFQSYAPQQIPKTLKVLLIINVAVYVLDFISKGTFTDFLGLQTGMVMEQGQIWRLVTYMFLHDLNSIMHILFNMLMLWMFGVAVIPTMGEKKFLGLYLSSGTFAGLCAIVFDLVMGRYLMYVGASGAVFAITVAFAWYFPRQVIMLFFLFPVQAKWAAAIFIGINILLVTSSDGIAHIVHLGGAFYALGYLRYESSLFVFWDRFKNRKKFALKNKISKATKDAYEQLEDIDSILEKISKSGIESLTRSEKKALEKASQAQKEKKSNIIKMEDYRRRR